MSYSPKFPVNASQSRSKVKLFLTVALAISLSGFGIAPAYANTAVITYVATGATSGTAPTSESVTRNSTVTLKSPGNLVKTGLIFRGWSTEANGGGTFYPQPGTIAVGTSDITLFPAFGGTVTFNNSGGFGSASSTSLDFVENRAFTLPSQGAMSKNGFTFSGWKDGTTATTFTGGGSSFSLGSGRTSPVILYAAWTRSVQYSLNGATIGTAPVSQVWLENTLGLTLPSSVNSGILRRGFDHVGWSTSTNGSPASGFSFIPSSSNTILYAAWAKQPTRQTLNIDFEPRTADLTAAAVLRIDALKATLSPTATFPKTRVKIFLGSWRHNSQSANLGKKRIAAVRKVFRDAGVDAKILTSNDSRSSGSARDARNNRIELISEWRN